MTTAEDRPVALVTGGGTGVGAATARQLARRGYNVAVNYSRSAAEAEETAAGLLSDGVDAAAFRGDVAVDADCRNLVGQTVERWGRLDVLVNSAGTTQFTPLADLENQNAEDLHRVFGVNVVGAYQMARAAAGQLRRSGRAAVVNVSSIAGLTGNGSSIAYVVSKGALNTLTLTLARLLSPEVRVNAVLPGLIDTRWLVAGLGEATFATVKDSFAQSSALEDVCTADDVADVVTFLAIDAAKMTGQLVTVDAGFLLGRLTKVSR